MLLSTPARSHQSSGNLVLGPFIRYRRIANDDRHRSPSLRSTKHPDLILVSGRNCPSGQVISWLWPYRSERAKYRNATHTFCVGSQRVSLCGGGQMALEFAIFRVETDACTWQESPRSLAAAKAQAQLLGALVSSLVSKRASRKPPRACLPAVLASALLLLCMVPTRAIAQQQIAVSETSSRLLTDAPLAKTDPESSAAHEISLAGGVSQCRRYRAGYKRSGRSRRRSELVTSRRNRIAHDGVRGGRRV